jgi:2-amino-4-hydroxy-6-hydroxymethyldihydropteridine diphosphokinase
MPRAGIALGSNLGDRIGHLRAAAAALRTCCAVSEPFLAAAIYATRPVDCPPGSPEFLNTVVEIGFDGTARQLLTTTLAIEINLGRIRSAERNAPRSIDIDLLYFGDDIIDTTDLTLPHPRIAQRRFVLQPLADIRPTLVLPGFECSVRELLAGLDDGAAPLVRFGDPL